MDYPPKETVVRQLEGTIERMEEATERRVFMARKRAVESQISRLMLYSK